jgi:hypothetical protein
MRSLVTLLLFLIAAPAVATDPPALSIAATPYSMSFGPVTAEIVDQGGGKFAIRQNLPDPTDSPLYPTSIGGQFGMSAKLSTVIGQQFQLLAAQHHRGSPADLTDKVVAAAYFEGANTSFGYTIVDVPLLIVDDGEGKYSGQFIHSATTYTCKLYGRHGNSAALADALAPNVGEIVTVRATMLDRGTPFSLANRVFVVYEVNP